MKYKCKDLAVLMMLAEAWFSGEGDRVAEDRLCQFLALAPSQQLGSGRFWGSSWKSLALLQQGLSAVALTAIWRMKLTAGSDVKNICRGGCFFLGRC